MMLSVNGMPQPKHKRTPAARYGLTAGAFGRNSKVSYAGAGTLALFLITKIRTAMNKPANTTRPHSVMAGPE